MMHSRIEDEEIVERYARDQLTPEERLEFEEHFFACDECFARLQDTERFIAGIREAAEHGTLSGDLPGTEQASRGWFIPAFVATAALTLILAATTAWLSFGEIPGLRRQIAQTSAGLRAQTEANANLATYPGNVNSGEANVPLVMLQSTRGIEAETPELAVPANAREVILWIETPASKYREYSLEISGAAGAEVAAVEHLERNSNGALAAGVPAEKFLAGTYKIKLTGEIPAPAAVVEEYQLKIRRP